jgi:hypothetical protein
MAMTALIILSPVSASAESPPDSTWMRAYGGPFTDTGMAVVQRPDGGFVFCGTTTASEGGSSDIFLTSIDAWGNTQWTRTYGGPDYDAAEDLVACPDGGYLIAGYTGSFGAGQSDVYAIRTDADGDTLWTRTYGGTGYEYGYGADLGFGGSGFVIAGSIDSWGAGMVDVYLVRIDDQGDTLWTRTIGWTDSEWAMSVRPTTDGGYAILGTTRSFGFGNDDLLFIQTNSSGYPVDSRSYGGASNDNGNDLQQTADGGYILVGSSQSYGTGGDIIVFKTNSGYAVDWSVNLGGDEWDTGEAVILSSEGTYIISGGDTDGGTMTYYAAELGSNGSLFWEGNYGGSGYGRAWSIIETADMGYAIAGQAYTSDASWQALLVRLNGHLPLISSITDIPNDQGKQARITWYSSAYDSPQSPYPIQEYTVWRRIAEWSASRERPGAFEILSYPPGKWDYVTTVPAMGELDYSTVVPTLCDSTIVDGMCYSAFCVMAHTSYPGVYFTSSADSGYSVDNLAPAAPTSLHMASADEVAWDEAPEEDFDYFTVYGSDSPVFTGAAFIGYTIGTEMDVSGYTYIYYYVTATDFSGNQGEPAMVDNFYARVGGDDIPDGFALRQNRPNPFGRMTAIGFDVSKDSHVTLEIIGIEGRVVRTLLDSDCSAGRHSATWDGCDASGGKVSPGVYFARMRAAEFTETRKLMLIK